MGKTIRYKGELEDFTLNSEVFCIFVYLLLVILWYKYQKKISLPWERESATE